MKIRILHCIETISSGGVERRRMFLSEYLDKDKYELKIICTWAGGPIADKLRELGVELIVVGSFKHPFEWQKHRDVLNVIKRFRPHIIHGAIFEGMTMAAIGGSIGHVPIIILEETSEPTTRSKKAIYLQRIFVMLSDKIIGISPAVCDFLIKKVKISEKKVLLINNGVPIPPRGNEKDSKSLKEKYGISEGDFIIGSVGRVFNDVKRFSDILESVKIINSPKIKFLLLGKGPDLEMLEDIAKKMGIEKQFISVGYHHDPNPFFNIMDVFCLPSAHEGFGLAAVEAMLHELPVIATKVGGLKNIVLDEVTGFLIPPQRPKLLAEKILDLLHDPLKRKKLGQSGYLRAKENYTSERYCKELEDLYLSELGKKG
ncbi:Glycosyltransferase involved in cell wall bisynthesis [Aquiflexum balticum DSM 16537]|uniref:Glycosyltransferase involved in cell wall bisynthesis n=1 Tax=Aquiflexum balticum DSM 16537 TaxID=758820 RepID=A0A1W2HBF2_9BACT|nr:glycosyltransferase family 4 protein [Aquiflexum balticum]SMD46052.1 Glycosyltransferase involved in cell wall bisynthesis [Aquiflexum balticum DSM 16537]